MSLLHFTFIKFRAFGWSLHPHCEVQCEQETLGPFFKTLILFWQETLHMQGETLNGPKTILPLISRNCAVLRGFWNSFILFFPREQWWYFAKGLFFLFCVLFLPPGLKQIHALSIQGNYELRIDLEDFENSTAYAQYATFGVGLFSVDADDDGYPLTVGDYSGNAGLCTHSVN